MPTLRILTDGTLSNFVVKFLIRGYVQTFYRDVLGHDRFRLVFKQWNAEEPITMPDARRRRQDSDLRCDNFDIILDNLARISQLLTARPTPCDVLCLLFMLLGCCFICNSMGRPCRQDRHRNLSRRRDRLRGAA